MALTLYFHPLSSFCHKALIALYENGTPFTPQKVDLMDEKENAAFKQIWPVGKFPVLRDDKNGKTIPESTSIIEYLAQHYPGPVQLVPKDADAGPHRARAGPVLRSQCPSADAEGHHRPAAAGRAERRIRMRACPGAACRRPWASSTRTWRRKPGPRAKPSRWPTVPPRRALFYYNRAVTPLAGSFDNVAAYLDRLVKRPSYARALKEAEPFLKYVPM